ncbi:MAG: hypothetical protein HUU41_01155 [Bryobacteraceae bacterium]|nr:DUF6298 domain-containing protein [Bryobacterales bacterium]NUM99696.1 hypothetical protein [Bryobacteraceae bacterium]
MVCRRTSSSWIWARYCLVAAVILLAMPVWAQRRAAGPLRVLQSNPRWFTDGSGKAVYLAGSHAWWTLQDNDLLYPAKTNPPHRFDFDGYLDFLERHNHNFFRLWRWEPPKWTDRYDKKAAYCTPHPWVRTGPGTAADGQPKFDLTRFNEEYFGRMRVRLTKAGGRGIYAAVMLFEGWAMQFTDGWTYHPFNGANNVNGVDADLNRDGKGLEFNSLELGTMARRVLDLQEAYVRKVIDTVNDLDNVLYEVSNEAFAGSTDWQYHMIRFVKQYELDKPKRHPVGMTFQYRGGANAVLYASPADWISPNDGGSAESFRDNPCADCTTKVVVSDTDHLWGHTGGDNVWVWKSFCRGLNVLFMEELLPSPTWQDSARLAMGQTRRYANKMDLASMKPEPAIARGGYCLAHRGREYLVFQPGVIGQFTVDLEDAPGVFDVEWLNVNKDETLAGKSVQGGAAVTFRTPFGGPAALYLKRSSEGK